MLSLLIPVFFVSSGLGFDLRASSTARRPSPASRAPNGEAGPVTDNLAVLREPGELPGEAQYLAVFSDGETAFSLAMVAGGSGHDSEFVTLVQELWVRRR